MNSIYFHLLNSLVTAFILSLLVNHSRKQKEQKSYGLFRDYPWLNRAEALKKLAELTVQNPSSNLKEVNTGIQKDDFSKLLSATPKLLNSRGKLNGSVSNGGGAGGSSGVRDRLSEVAIAKKEYEVIIALSDATKEPMKVDSQIQTLINKFKAYLFELPDQKFAYSIVSNSATISPWNLLGEN